jgi:hypothetical protein
MINFDAEKLREANEVCVVKRMGFDNGDKDVSVYPYPFPIPIESARPIFVTNTARVSDVATLLTIMGLEVYVIKPPEEELAPVEFVLFEPTKSASAEPQQTTSVDDSFEATLLKAAEEHVKRQMQASVSVGSQYAGCKPLVGEWIDVTTMGDCIKRWVRVS